MTLSIKAGSTVLFIGDSITAGGRDYNAVELGHGFVQMAAHSWALTHPDHPITVLNHGIGGNRVADLRGRWTQDAIDPHPDIVTIMIGVNETWRAMSSGDPTSIAAYEADYRHILGRLVDETEAQILLIEPFLLPVTSDQWTWRSDLDPRIQVTRRLAGEFGTTFVSVDGRLNQLAVNAGGNCDGQAAGFARYADDGVHPTAAGAAVIADAWLAETVAG